MAEDVRGEVARLLAKVCEVDPGAVDPSADLMRYGLDSVRAVDFVIELEERFGIEIAEDDARGLRSVDAVARYLAERAP